MSSRIRIENNITDGYLSKDPWAFITWALSQLNSSSKDQLRLRDRFGSDCKIRARASTVTLSTIARLRMCYSYSFDIHVEIRQDSSISPV